MDRLSLEIVTPKGKALSETVDEVTVPGLSGEFGVLPGHLPLLVAVRSGLVSFRVGNDTRKCAVGVGFAEVGPEKALILTDEFSLRDAIDPVLVRQELTHVQTALQAEETTKAERRTLIQKESWLAAQLDLYGGEAVPAVMQPGEDWDRDDEVVGTADDSAAAGK